MSHWRIALLAPVACLLAGCPYKPSWTPVSPETLSESRTGAKYRVYAPSSYSADRPWAAAVTLHGSAGWDDYWRQVEAWKGLAERHGFIVVAPRLRSAEGILPTPGREDRLREDEEDVLAILDEVQREYNVPAGSVLLTGFSAGGYPLYWIGLRNPERFDMLVARACNSRVEDLERIELTDAVLPIRIFWGKADLGVIQKDSWKAYAWLRRRRCFQTTKHEVEGGHIRNPSLAVEFWRQLPEIRRMTTD